MLKKITIKDYILQDLNLYNYNYKKYKYNINIKKLKVKIKNLKNNIKNK